jgi:hypothetical protein
LMHMSAMQDLEAMSKELAEQAPALRFEKE